MNKNQGYGSYFDNGHSSQKPLDIDPNSWANISAENNYVYAAPNTQPQRRVPSQQSSAGERQQISPRKKTPPQGTRPKERAKGGAKKRKPEQKAVLKEEKLISRGPEAPKNSAKKKKQKKYVFTKREQNRIKRNKQKFAALIKKGKTRDEARRILSLKRHKARRLNTFLSVLVMFVFAFTFAVAYCYSEGAPIKEIIIEGDKTAYSQQQIMEAAGISKGQSMLTVREGEVNDLLQTKLPFISGVKIKYKFPDTLKIDITSTEEKYIIKNGNKYMCLDKNGKIVSLKKMKVGKEQFLVTGLPFTAPQIGETFVPASFTLSEEERAGLKDSELTGKLEEIKRANAAEVKRYNTMLEIVRLCDKYDLMKGGRINIGDMTEIELIYDSRVRLHIGTDENLELKIDAAAQIIRSSVKKGEKGYIDLSHDKGKYYFLPGAMEY